jgi:diadenylate cyclase
MHWQWWHRWTGDDFIGLAHATVDVLVVAYLVFRLLMLAKGTRAWQIFTGLLVVFVILQLSDWWQLTGLKWLLQQMFQLGPVAIVILFYPELRHALEDFGRRGFWGQNFAVLEKEDVSLMVGEIVHAASNLSDKKIGALIVLERETGLTDIIGTGTSIDGTVTAELMGTLFYPGSPLHDGAAIIRRGRVVAAGCTLPLSESREIGTTVHTRHKAALGMSEQSDALVLVVSEESGIISLAFNGKMVRGLRDDALRDRLMQSYMGRERLAAKRRRTAVRPLARPPESPFKSIAPFLTIRHDRTTKSSSLHTDKKNGRGEEPMSRETSLDDRTTTNQPLRMDKEIDREDEPAPRETRRTIDD